MVELRESMLSVFAKLTRFLYVKGPNERFEKNRLIQTIYRFFYRSFKPSGVVLAEAQGFKMFVDSRDEEIAAALLRWGIYEKRETALFRELVRKGMVVIDVGANIGYFTILASHLVGEEGRIFAFEPEPYNHSLLCMNVKTNKCDNVIVVQKAVYSKSGSMTLFLERNNLGGHSLSEQTVLKMAGSIAVETISLDEFFENKDFRVDFIKLDAEGAEAAIVQGMANLIRKNNKLIMICEFSPALLRKFGFSPMDFLNRLMDYDFSLYEIGRSLEPINVRQFSSICAGNARNLLCIKH